MRKIFKEFLSKPCGGGALNIRVFVTQLVPKNCIPMFDVVPKETKWLKNKLVRLKSLVSKQKQKEDLYSVSAGKSETL